MSAAVYLSATDVTVDVPFQDHAGNPLTVASAKYRVTDQTDQELVTPTDLNVADGDTTVSIQIPASLNTVATGATREIRNVEVFCVVGGNTIILSKSYGLTSNAPLQTGLNSFQTYSQASLTALDIPNLDAWENASEEQRVAALIDARERIVQLNFNLLNSNVNFGQDSLQYVPEGQYQSSYVARNSLFIFNGNLAILNPTQFAALPERFKKALRQAQVVEADHILGGNPYEDKRQSGLVLDAIGESKQMFRSTKALQLPVCRRALGYLSYFVTFSKRIGRAG